MGGVEAKRALVSQVVGREVVRATVPVLAQAGVPVLLLKGIWLQAHVYAAHEPRIITDVDLLVPEAAFERALVSLERAGWRRRSQNVSEAALRHAGFELALDLHRRLFTRGAFRLPTADVFGRSRRDDSGFGVEVHLPDPRDGYAHLLGHFVKSRTRPDDEARLRDFVAIAERCAIDPEDCARHLHAVGMARAARYVLRELAERRRHAFTRALLAALPRDRVGDGLSRIARAAAALPPGSPLGALPGFMLDRSLPAAGRAFALRVLDIARERRNRTHG